MLHPASLKDAPQYPVTTSVAALAIAITGMWWLGRDIDGLILNGQVWAKLQLWRALTSTLPHVNLFHLAFNLYWFWTFGTLVEREFGHFKYTLMLLLLAFAPMLAEFTFFSGGVGLSGVGYGLWGMLWVLEKRDERFAGAVDYQTSQMFIVWFFLCIVLTATHVMPVANVAHGVGAVMGALLGLAASSDEAVKWKGRVGLAAVVLLTLAGATVFWPWVNFSGNAEPVVERAGLEALERGNFPRAVKLLETSAHMRGAPARAWYNLGIAYQRQGKYDVAVAALEHAAQMPDGTAEYQQVAAELKGDVQRSQQRWRELATGTNAGPNTQTNR